MHTLVGFLKAVLPEQGYLCAAIQYVGSDGEKKLRHVFCSSHEELAEVLLREDRAGNTVYHACASYEQPTWRRKNNVQLLKSLWMDVDAGEGKPYASAQVAYREVKQFCAKARLPRPIVVSSGAGLHLYWPLTEAIDRGTWEVLALGLKSAARGSGFSFDPARACDAASILRPPGSHNRKYQDFLVRASLSGASASDISSFSHLQRENSGGVGQGTLGPVPLALRHIKKLTGAEVRRDYEPSDGRKVANLCAQIRDVFITKSPTTTEPVWFAACAVLAWCEDGDKLVHEWSRGDDRYRFDDTQGRLDRARDVSGPRTCENFSDLNPKGCDGCPFRGSISTPVELGRDVGRLHGRHEEGRKQVNGHHIALPAQPEDGSILLPEGYKWGDEGGLYKLGIPEWGKAGATSVDIRIIAHPFYLSEVQAGSSFNYVFSYKKPLKDWETFTIGAEIASGMNASSKIRGGCGVVIHNYDAFKTYLQAAHTMLEEQKISERRFEQNGWFTDGFVIGLRKYVNGESRPAALSNMLADNAFMFNPTGSYAEWHKAMSLVLTAGVNSQILCFIAALGSVFMRFQASSEGGGIISLVSQASGRGKSVALQCAASVWGGWRGLSINNNDSMNYKMIKLGEAQHLPVFYDEIIAQDPKSLRDFIAIYSEGKDRGRATVDGKAQRQPYTWSNILVTSSNASLIDTLQSISTASIQNAPGMRILEFMLHDKIKAPGQGTDYITKLFASNYGWVGNYFLRYITHPKVAAGLRDQLEASRHIFEVDYKLPPEHRFWIRTLTCCHTAATILNTLQLFPQFDFTKVVLKAVAELIAGNATAFEEVTDERSSIDNLCRYIADNFKDFLIVDKFTGGSSMVLQGGPRVKIVARSERKEQRLYVSESHLRRWCVDNGVNMREMLGQLKHQKVLLEKCRINVARGTDLPPATLPVFVFDQSHPRIQELDRPIP